MTQSNFIFTLDQPVTLELAGGKGWNLMRLAQAGIPLPPGFVITTSAYDAFIQYNQLAECLVTALAGLQQGRSPAEISGQVGDAFAKSVFPPELAGAISSAYRDLGKLAGQAVLPVAIRSSATTEDLPEASFAGQHDSFLNIRGETPVQDAVRRCFSSLWNERAIDYRAHTHQGIASQSAKLAVVVQQMVCADAAGVLFTVNPLNGNQTQMVIDAVWGLGESQVSGLVTPDHLIIDIDNSARGRKTISAYQVAEKTTMIVSSGNDLLEQSIPLRKRKKRVLKNKQIRTLIELAQTIVKLFGSPQDLEWCRANGKFYIIQSRPITTLSGSPVSWDAPGPGRWVHGGGLYEMFSEPVSPLFATLLVPIFSEALLQMMAEAGLKDLFPGDHYRIVNGFLYQHLSFRLRPRHLCGLIKLLITLPNILLTHETEQKRYRETVVKLTRQPVIALADTELLERIQALGSAGMRYWQQIMTIALMSYRQEGKFGRFFWRQYRSGDPEPETLLCGQPIQSWQAECSIFELALLTKKLGLDGRLLADPLQFWAHHPDQAGMREWRDALATHLERYGHQLFSVDLSFATLADDPRLVLTAIQAFLRGKESPYARQNRMAAECDVAIASMENHLSPRNRNKFRQLLNEARKASRVREDSFFDLGLAWTYLHRYAIELGTRLMGRGMIAQPEDIFWLRLEDIRAGLSEPSTKHDFFHQVAGRRANNELWSRVEAPFLLPVGSRPGFWLGRTRFTELQRHPDASTLVGLGVSPGKVTAVARVIHSLDEIQRLQIGEILVTRATTPAWTPIFTQIAGLVTDTGGPLAHGSIVAREVGIPAVMGTGNATRQIRDGQTITILGGAGRVLLH